MPHFTVLLVDDDPALRSSITFALEVEGFDVRAFATAEAALRTGAGRDVGCIVIDHRLPGVDGLALLGTLRERGHPWRAVVIASNPSPHLRDRVAAAGASLVEKPLLGDALAATVRAIRAGLRETGS